MLVIISEVGRVKEGEKKNPTTFLQFLVFLTKGTEGSRKLQLMYKICLICFLNRNVMKNVRAAL